MEPLDENFQTPFKTETPDISDTIKLKISLIGKTGCGKTSIIDKFINNSFSKIYEPTYDIEQFNN